MDPLAQHLDLTLSNDEKLAPILSLNDQVVTERDLFGLETTSHPCQDRIGHKRNQRHAPQGLRRQREHAVVKIELDPIGLAQLDLSAIDTIRAAVNVNPRQQAEQPAR